MKRIFNSMESIEAVAASLALASSSVVEEAVAVGEAVAVREAVASGLALAPSFVIRNPNHRPWSEIDHPETLAAMFDELLDLDGRELGDCELTALKLLSVAMDSAKDLLIWEESHAAQKKGSIEKPGLLKKTIYSPLIYRIMARGNGGTFLNELI